MMHTVYVTLDRNQMVLQSGRRPRPHFREGPVAHSGGNLHGRHT
ncbi:hypothetical protein NKDENANG_03498 [Candidatus Entotheonellaceae bacterium PAL068K]